MTTTPRSIARSTSPLQNDARKAIHAAGGCVGANERNVVETRADGAHFAAADIENEAREQARAARCEDIDRGVANHPTARRVEAKLLHERQKHAWMRFTASTLLDERQVAAGAALVVMQADFHGFNAYAVFGKTLDDGFVCPGNGSKGNLAFGCTGLVGGHGKDEPGILQCSKAFDDAGEKAHVARMKSADDGAKLLVAHEVDECAVSVDDDAGAAGHEVASATIWRSRSQMRWW